MIQETIRAPAWFGLFWVEASADPNATNGQVPIAGASPMIRTTVDPKTPLPRGVTMAANTAGVLFQQGSYDPNNTKYPPRPIAMAAGQTGITLKLRSLDGRFNPRIFNAIPPAPGAAGAPPAPAAAGTSLAGPTVQYVALRPSPQATNISESGALAVNLQWLNTPGAPPVLVPASWAVVRLTCSRGAVNYGFTGQADINGDVVVSFTGLPPTGASGPQAPDVMTLSVFADSAFADAASLGRADGSDTDALLAKSPIVVTATPVGGGAATAVTSLTITRGQITTAGFTGFTLQVPQTP